MKVPCHGMHQYKLACLLLSASPPSAEESLDLHKNRITMVHVQAALVFAFGGKHFCNCLKRKLCNATAVALQSLCLAQLQDCACTALNCQCNGSLKVEKQKSGHTKAPWDPDDPLYRYVTHDNMLCAD